MIKIDNKGHTHLKNFNICLQFFSIYDSLHANNVINCFLLSQRLLKLKKDTLQTFKNFGKIFLIIIFILLHVSNVFNCFIMTLRVIKVDQKHHIVLKRLINIF